MRLYHHPMSSNARRAVMTVHHLGLDVELVIVDLFKGEQKQPEFVRMNPSGKVPLLDDGGFYLSESHAIMQYLADSAGGQTVYPKEPRARADVNRWMFWNAFHLAPSVQILAWERIVKPMRGLGAPDPVLVSRGEELVNEAARVLDGHLAGKTWISGDDVTLADLAIAATLMSEHPAKLPIGGYANIQAWFGRAKELEAWKKTQP